jgi:hypothetical protein
MQKHTTRPRHYSRAAAADTTTQNATTNNTGKKQKTSSWPDQTVFTPPIWMLFLGAIGFFAAFGANCWQVYTSFSAFQHMFITGSVYKAMSPGDQERSLTVVNLFSFIIAFSCQLALVFLIFRIERRWKEERAQGKSTSKVEAAKHTAVEVVNHIPLVVIWGVLGLVADTLGDVVFEGLYTNDWFLLFMYGACLYALSGIGLPLSLECIWSGWISWEKFAIWKQTALEFARGQQTPNNTQQNQGGA